MDAVDYYIPTPDRKSGIPFLICWGRLDHYRARHRRYRLCWERHLQAWRLSRDHWSHRRESKSSLPVSSPIPRVLRWACLAIMLRWTSNSSLLSLLKMDSASLSVRAAEQSVPRPSSLTMLNWSPELKLNHLRRSEREFLSIIAGLILQTCRNLLTITAEYDKIMSLHNHFIFAGKPCLGKRCFLFPCVDCVATSSGEGALFRASFGARFFRSHFRTLLYSFALTCSVTLKKFFNDIICHSDVI